MGFGVGVKQIYASCLYGIIGLWLGTSHAEGFEIGNVDGKVIKFQVPEGSALPKELKTEFYGIQAHGVLRESETSPPFVLFSGTECESCTAQRFLHLVRADGKKEITLVYPGKVRDRKKGGILMEADTYYGRCLPGHSELVISFMKERLDRRRYLQEAVFTAEIAGDQIEERLLTRRRGKPQLSTVKAQVKRKNCFQVSGIDRDSMEFKIPYLSKEAVEPDEEAKKPEKTSQ